MKILFLSFWFPYPPNNGSRIRLYHFIKALAEKHQVFLVSLLQEDSDPADAANLADMCTVVSLHRSRRFNPNSLNSLFGFFSSKPRSIIDTYDRNVRDAVHKAVAEISPDVIVASTLDLVEYLPAYIPVPSVLIDHNCEYAVLKRNAAFITGALKRWRYDLGWKKFARWEADTCRRFTSVVMPTELDKQAMLDFAPDLTNIHVIPNGADTEHFDPESWAPVEDTLMYNGAMTYSANLDAVSYFASEIYPVLKLSRPKVKLTVTGRTDGVDLKAAESWQGIEFSGYVDDIRDVLYSSMVCVVPLRRGGGMRLKIPEAMAAGVPVVSTSMGAEGLDCNHGQHLLIADTPSDFAGAVQRLLEDQDLAQRLRKSARELIERRYSWKALASRFEALVAASVTNLSSQVRGASKEPMGTVDDR